MCVFLAVLSAPVPLDVTGDTDVVTADGIVASTRGAVGAGGAAGRSCLLFLRNSPFSVLRTKMILGPLGE